tara:strand:- start:415 stop:624 length:210 start_codon:yes stop_codon:yes gene_type:complete
MIEIYSTSKTKIIRFLGFAKIGFRFYRQFKSKGLGLIFGILNTEIQIVIARRSNNGTDNEKAKGPRAFA